MYIQGVGHAIQIQYIQIVRTPYLQDDIIDNGSGTHDTHNTPNIYGTAAGPWGSLK